MSLSVALPQQGYYCHQCNLAITIAAPASRDDKVFCPVCAGGFVEELFDDEEPPNPIPHHQPHPSPFFPFSSFLDLRNRSDLAVVPRPALPSATPPPPPLPPPPTPTTSSTSTSAASSPAAPPSRSSSRAPPSPADSSPSVPAGSASSTTSWDPASSSSSSSSRRTTPATTAPCRPPRLRLPPSLMSSSMGGTQHVLHKDCILPWLDLHSSSLSAAIYDHHSQAGAAAVAAPASPGGGPSPRVMVRRFRISLLWPLRAAFGAQRAESSDQDAAGYGDYKNDGNASGRSYDDLD